MSRVAEHRPQTVVALERESQWPRSVVAAVTAVKVLQGIALVVVANGAALSLVPVISIDEAWRSLLLPAAALVLVTARPSLMAWGTCMTLFVLSLVSRLTDFEVSVWAVVTITCSVAGVVALAHPAALRWLRRVF